MQRKIPNSRHARNMPTVRPPIGQKPNLFGVKSKPKLCVMGSMRPWIQPHVHLLPHQKVQQFLHIAMAWHYGLKTASEGSSRLLIILLGSLIASCKLALTVLGVFQLIAEECATEGMHERSFQSADPHRQFIQNLVEHAQLSTHFRL